MPILYIRNETDDGWYEVLLQGTLRRQAIFTMPGIVGEEMGSMKLYNLTGADLNILMVHLSTSGSVGSSDLIVDINIDGTTIFTNQNNRPIIEVGYNVGYTSNIDVSRWPDGSYITQDIDQVGDASDLVCTVIAR